MESNVKTLNADGTATPPPNTMEVYKFTPKFFVSIVEIIEKRPYSEVHLLLDHQLLQDENGNAVNMMTSDGLNQIVTYLQQLPAKEVRHVFSAMKADLDSVVQTLIVPVPAKNLKGPAEETADESVEETVKE